MTKVGWYAVDTSTTLESNKSLHGLGGRCCAWVTLRSDGRCRWGPKMREMPHNCKGIAKGVGVSPHNPVECGKIGSDTERRFFSPISHVFASRQPAIN